MNYFSQSPFSVRLEWGPAAIRNLGPTVDCIVVLDVMSFSTCVSLAVERGAIIYPYPWRDERAQQYGQERNAEVASGKRRFADGWSLSPQSMLRATDGLRLVLPSPNGSACVFHARDLGKAVFSACLRNLRATAQACSQYKSILVVPCGERWAADDSLRPSFEDYVAAGRLVTLLNRTDVSPEARAASLVWQGLEDRYHALQTCSSALELVCRGFTGDVELCLEEDASHVACRLHEDHFIGEASAEPGGSKSNTRTGS